MFWLTINVYSVWKKCHECKCAMTEMARGDLQRGLPPTIGDWSLAVAEGHRVA